MIEKNVWNIVYSVCICVEFLLLNVFHFRCWLQICIFKILIYFSSEKIKIVVF